MIQKQTNDKIWETIKYFQLFLPIKNYIDRNIFKLEFDYEQECRLEDFKRAGNALKV